MLQPSRTLFADQRRWCRGPCICPRYILGWFLWTRSNQVEWKLPGSHNVRCASPTHFPGLFILCKKGTSFVLSHKICQCTASAGDLLRKHTLEIKERKMIEVMSFSTSCEQHELVTDFENRGKRNRLPNYLMSESFFRFALIQLGWTVDFKDWQTFKYNPKITWKEVIGKKWITLLLV